MMKNKLKRGRAGAFSLALALALSGSAVGSIPVIAAELTTVSEESLYQSGEEIVVETQPVIQEETASAGEETITDSETIQTEAPQETEESVPAQIYSQPMLVQYKVLNMDGSEVSQIKNGENVNIEVVLKNAGILTSQIAGGTLDVNHLVGDFHGGSAVEVSIISQPEEPLMAKLLFRGETYSGQGRKFAFSVGYPGLYVAYDQLAVDILECVPGSTQGTQTPAESETNSEKQTDTSMDLSGDNAPGFSASDFGASFSSADFGSSGGVSMGATLDSNTKTPVDGPTPNIIIDSYDYGGGRVGIGKDFNLRFSFMNTSSSKKIENIIMTVETSEGLALTSSASNFFYNQLNAGARQDVHLGMSVLPDTKSGIQGINVTYKYEYVDNNKRSQVSVTGKVAVPVYFPERFGLTEPMVPSNVKADEEVSISIPYVNKGKGSIANVEAVIDGDIETTIKRQNIGNIEAGKSGTIDFVVIPRKAGETSFKIQINYEDENQDVKTQEFTIALNVSEAETQMDMSMQMMEETQVKKFPIIPVVIAVVGAGGVGFFIKRKRQKKNKNQEETFEIWSDDESTKDEETK